MKGYTNFTKVYADEVRGISLVGTLNGTLAGSVISTNTISKAVDYALTATEKAKLFTAVEMTAASKVLTLGLAEGQAMIVYNSGATNAFTVKNIATDTGTSLSSNKAILVIGSATKDASIVIALN